MALERRVLVTGVTGFIGSHVGALLAERHNVVGTGRKACSLAFPYWQTDLGGEEFEEQLAAFRPEVIVHCAGPSSVQASIQDPRADFRAGPELLMRLYDSVRKSGLRPFVIQISSAAVYGDPATLPVSEDAPMHPLSPYGWHKEMAELAGREYADGCGIPGLALRVFSCYGEGQRKLLLWDAAKKLSSGTAAFFGTGRETRDYLHVRDLARLVLLLAEDPPAEGFRAVNAGSGQAVSVERVITLLRQALDREDVALVFNGDARRGDPRFWQADARRLSELGFSPEIGLEEGLAAYARWFRDLPDAEKTA